MNVTTIGNYIRTSELHNDLLAVLGALDDVEGDALELASEHILGQRQYVHVLNLSGAHLDPLVACGRVAVRSAFDHLAGIIVVFLRNHGYVARWRCGQAMLPMKRCTLTCD